jgi:organic hydroperoxide reductase OsmC/OhrA
VSRDYEARVVWTGDRGGGTFEAVTPAPAVTLARGDPDRAKALHAEAYRRCFIANSVNFPVTHRPTIRVHGH